MKAILMTAPGGPDVLQYTDIPVPSLSGAHDMLVRLKAAGVNPVDTKLRGKGTYYPGQMPAILGCDGAGMIEAVGPAVSRFKPGDAVYFCNGGIGGHPGNYAEYAVVDEAWAAAKPAALSFAEAAAAPLVLITAWEALHDRARMQAGQTVLVHAGAGGVGHVAIQLACAAGCQVITTVSSGIKAQFVRELAAVSAIDYRSEDLAEAVRAWSGGDGVDIAFDTVGGAVFEQSFAAVRPYGDLVTLLQPDAGVNWKLARMRNLRISLELMLSPMYYGWDAAQAHQADILRQCAALFDAGKLRIHLSHVLPLSQAAEAHRLLEQGGTQGKIVLTME
ncbi:MAG: alcohol dehydrogenase [Gammaproteobacteria bacterium HGW-Gammaproteobacteria-1]|jgi:NADPH2:quinone reductase|nr:MAG: alcohol dehydrogenase [Gammaproteobacteria bacterium HGW-Gammaproteobacteria-1]